MQKVSVGLKILCFFIPLVGLIIFAVNISTNEQFAKECGLFSLIGFFAPIIIAFIILIYMLLCFLIFAISAGVTQNIRSSSFSTSNLKKIESSILQYQNDTDNYVSSVWNLAASIKEQENEIDKYIIKNESPIVGYFFMSEYKYNTAMQEYKSLAANKEMNEKMKAIEIKSSKGIKEYIEEYAKAQVETAIPSQNQIVYIDMYLKSDKKKSANK